MEIKPIDGVRVAAGETLVVVMTWEWTQKWAAELYDYTSAAGIRLILLPPGSKVYVAEGTAHD